MVEGSTKGKRSIRLSFKKIKKQNKEEKRGGNRLMMPKVTRKI